MTRLHSFLVFLILILLPLNTHAKNDLVTSASTNEIGISSSFTGQDFVVFGTLSTSQTALSAPLDVIVTLRGPEEKAVVRKKERIIGLWLNQGEYELGSVPSYGAILTHKELKDIADLWTLRAERIGLENLLLSEIGIAPSDKMPGDNIVDFIQAYIRIKQSDGLFIEDTAAVKFLSPNVFRADIRLPANVPVGPYTIDVHVFQDQELVAKSTSAVDVVKTGFERDVTYMAQNQPWIYGITAVFVAIFAGWMASVIVRS